MLAYSAITSTSDYASTSNLNDTAKENNVSNIDELYPRNEVTETTTDSFFPCTSCPREIDLAQSFVLYFAPAVILLALILCIIRLLYTFCTFRRQQVISTTQSSSSSTQHHNIHRHTRNDDDLRSIRYHIRGSFAHIFMQTPPPTYEQAQKHSVPFESPNDPAPPAYAYENPINIRDEHPPTTSTTSTINVADIQPSTNICNQNSIRNTSNEGTHTNRTAPSTIS